jgi:hypothetical protein
MHECCGAVMTVRDYSDLVAEHQIHCVLPSGRHRYIAGYAEDGPWCHQCQDDADADIHSPGHVTAAEYWREPPRVAGVRS